MGNKYYDYYSIKFPKNTTGFKNTRTFFIGFSFADTVTELFLRFRHKKGTAYETFVSQSLIYYLFSSCIIYKMQSVTPGGVYKKLIL